MAKVIRLEDLTKRKGPLSPKQLKQVQQWLADDWEAKDIPKEAVALIGRLMATFDVYGVLE